ncbi:hypothetical protein SELMODRAFT_430394 [Selaginella moellendorffii]|uniref:Uncharacterized protein n=1 Tax=Selaginella moellendorffii TaxID=88036 RepID=D8T9A2_SELML|nr:hypothetical protein SELMODRAFT_430394 [Selaginella moellendorffii]
MKVTLVCKKSDRRILYLEASKECVDVLFSFLLLPVGSSMKLVHGEAQVGVARIFTSVQQMDDAVMHVDKKLLVDPQAPEGFMDKLLGIENALASSGGAAASFKPSDHSFYRCSSGRLCPAIAMDDNTQRCTTCGFVMNVPVQVLASPAAATRPAKPPSSSSQGFVKENVTFMITDDLQIFPVSVAKSVALMSMYKVEAVSDLETIELQLGPVEVLQLLKTSLGSLTVLNDVFQARLPKFAPQRVRYP